MRHNRRDTTRYAYDIRNAQTQSVNRHFSEYLFYADSLPTGATAYYNGNISASRIHNGDSVFTMGYLYDAQNRLTESLYLCKEAQSATAEFFEYDAMGNIRRLQRYTQEQQLIDDLQYTHCGNQVQNITDYVGSADQYAVKEYQDLNTTDSVEQFYDPNGNLIIDLDRGITHIAYNLLNLPDTICFANGNRIINRYDAAGNKQETQTITLQDTKFSSVPLNGVIFDTSQADTCITRYSGNREFMYTPSRQRESLLLQKSIIRHAEGYTQYTYTGASDSPQPMQYYFYKDHLGNVCAVWNATTDEVVQRTNYYPSGVPMAQSTGQSVQPLKYNAYEYIETHGYDTYDYGFRGYYATIGCFTSIDPLCERTPWQSPYAYANNNWINQVDIFGLAGSDAYTTQDPAKISKLLDFLADGGSLDTFDFDEEGWEECFVGKWWIKNEELYYVLATMMGDISGGNGSYQLPELTTTLMHTKMTSSNATTNLKDIRDGYIGNGWKNTAGDIIGWGSAITGVAGNATCNDVYWFGKNGKVYTVNQRLKGAKGNYVYNRSYELAKCRFAALKVVGVASSVVCTGIDLGICINNPTPDNQMNLAMDLVAFIPYVGWMISTTYFFTNQYVTYKTGVGIGQYLYDLFEQ